MAVPEIKIAMIGYAFMGRAHSNAWRQVAHVFDVPRQPVMQVVCGRNETAVADAALRLGWREHATSWQEVVARPDIDVVDICTPGDSHLEIAQAAAEATGARIADDAEDVLCAEDVDIVAVLTPAFTHADLVEAAENVAHFGVRRQIRRVAHREGVLVVAKLGTVVL